MESNILFADKPEGIFSRQCMHRVCEQAQIKEKKKGIEGILDSFASGLLIVATGYATRYLGYFLSLPRTYCATLRLGVTTDTLDPTGKQVALEQEVPPLDRDLIIEIFQEMMGEITQKPPIFSNVKINGVAARKLARKGQQPDIKPRKVFISTLELLDFSENEIKFLAKVSSGTYIRSLALSIAKKLGTTCYLTYLRRIKIGEFDVDDTINSPLDIDNNSTIISNNLISFKRMPMSEALYWFDEAIVSKQEATALQQGKRIIKTNIQEIGFYKVKDHDGKFYGLAKKKDNYLYPQKMLPL